MCFKLILKGKYILIDIREMYQKDGEDRPGKGIALNPEQYNNIKVRLAIEKISSVIINDTNLKLF